MKFNDICPTLIERRKGGVFINVEVPMLSKWKLGKVEANWATNLIWALQI